jgi:hypothetical protein
VVTRLLKLSEQESLFMVPF